MSRRRDGSTSGVSSTPESQGLVTWDLVGQSKKAGLSSEGTSVPWRVMCRLKCASVAHLGHGRVNVCLPGADRKAVQTSGSGQTHSCLMREARKGDCLRVFKVERAEKGVLREPALGRDSSDQDSPSAGPRA